MDNDGEIFEYLNEGLYDEGFYDSFGFGNYSRSKNTHIKGRKEEKKEDLKKKKKKKIDEAKSAFDPNIDFEGKYSV